MWRIRPPFIVAALKIKKKQGAFQSKENLELPLIIFTRSKIKFSLIA